MLTRFVTTIVAIAAIASATTATASAMSNGQPTPGGSAPWFAAVQFRDGATVDGTIVSGDRLARNHCGGALIDPRTVLTAAHCVSDPAFAATDPRRRLSVDSFRVILGDHALSDSRSPELSISRIDIDPNFALVPNPKDPTNLDSAAAGNDLALMTLSTPVSQAKTIALSTTAGRRGTPVVMYGHGLVPDGVRSDPLLRGSLAVISSADCARQSFVDPVREGMICAQSPTGSPSVQAGYGDSGGPMVIRDPGGRASLVGIFSFGTETVGPIFSPGFNAATDVRIGALRWPALRGHLHL